MARTSPGSPGPSLEVVSEGSAPCARTIFPQTSVDSTPTWDIGRSAEQAAAQQRRDDLANYRARDELARDLHGVKPAR